MRNQAIAIKRAPLLALAAVLLLGCETATEPTAPQLETTFSTTPTSYSGRATVVDVTVTPLGLTGPIHIPIADTGPLPESGGELEQSLLAFSISEEQTAGVLALSGEVAHATAVAQGESSRAEASVATVDLTLEGIGITAEFLRAAAEAVCTVAGPVVTGGSQLVDLVINGERITISGARNQTIELPNATIIINEQDSKTAGNKGDITVSALHVTAYDYNPLTGARGQKLAEVVIARAHADIACGRCAVGNGDFVTGGGWVVAASGSRGNFGVAGGLKNGLWGHLTYVEKGGMKVKGVDVLDYKVLGPNTRYITGRAEVNHEPGGTYEVTVTDNGEPGREDYFELKLNGAVVASGPLAGGNIQLHPKTGPCPPE
jgi:hypothetical protein